MIPSRIPAALRIGLILWIAAALPAWWMGRSIALGVLLGGALGLANLWALYRIVGGIAHARGARSAALGVLLAAKFLALAGLVVLCLRVGRVHPLAFVSGISIFVVALLVAHGRRTGASS
jgi:hypothetical protein